MIKTIIGGINVEEYITDYYISNPPVYGAHSFTDITGVDIVDKRGDKVILKLTLEMPTPVALAVAEKLQMDSVTVDYTTPVPKSNVFKKTSYDTKCDDADPEQYDFDITDNIIWIVNVTLESIDYARADGL